MSEWLLSGLDYYHPNRDDGRYPPTAPSSRSPHVSPRPPAGWRRRSCSRGCGSCRLRRPCHCRSSHSAKHLRQHGGKVLAACDRLHHILDRQKQELHSGTAGARRWRNLRRDADVLEAEIAAMPLRTAAGRRRRAIAEVALRLVPRMPGLMVLARASLLDLSRQALEDEPSGSDAELLLLLREVEIRQSADFRREAMPFLRHPTPLPAATVHGRRAKAQVLLGALTSKDATASWPADGPEQAMALSLARDVLAEPRP